MGGGGCLSFANHLLGDSAPPHLPGTCVPTPALRRDTCLRRTHPGSQCTTNSGRSGFMRFCCAMTPTPPLVFASLSPSSRGQLTYGWAGPPPLWTTSHLPSSVGRRHGLPIWLPLRRQASLETFSSCRRPTERARAF